jgi:hypothetical protein
MSAKVKDLIWLNKLIKDPDRDAFEAERGEKDKDLERTPRQGLFPKKQPHRKGGRNA